MGQKKCDCEGKMLAALGVGALFGLLIGLVIGWGGARSPDGTSFILAFCTSVGTVGAVIFAVTAYCLQSMREKAQRTADGALAVYAEKDSLQRIRTSLLSCAYDLRDGGDGKLHGKDLSNWIAESARILESKLHPQYAAFNRTFIRLLLDARATLDEVEWLIIIGNQNSLEMLVLLDSAAKRIGQAEDVCELAKKEMEAWWA